jgi:hypothetical protein
MRPLNSSTGKPFKLQINDFCHVPNLRYPMYLHLMREAVSKLRTPRIVTGYRTNVVNVSLGA